MRISIGLKWTATAVLLIVLVVSVYAFMTIRDASEDVERQTVRLTEIQETALDQIGVSTAKYLSLPASSLMFDTDLSGLTGLLSPVVEKGQAGSGNEAIYATIFAPTGRVWVAVASPEVSRIKLEDDEYFFDRSREDNIFKENLNQDVLEKLIENTSHEDVMREIERDGKSGELKVREYLSKIMGGDEHQGYLLIAYSLEGLTNEVASIKKAGDEKKSETINRSIWLAIMAIVLGFVVAIVQSLAISRNISSLSKVASQIAMGDLSVRSSIKSRDEIGQLGEQFNVMANRVQALMAETEEKASLEKELDIARSIQSTLLPEPGRSRSGRFDLNGYFQPASVCGGDFWGYRQLPDGSTLLTMGDVTGHGVPSAMITASAKSGLDTLINMWDERMTLSTIMEELNKTICETAKSNLFMTFLAMRLSHDARFIEVANAGHNFPLMCSAQAPHEVRAIVARGERLGDNASARYASVRIETNPGDCFLLFTDGITEYIDAHGQEYGERRLRKVFQSHAAREVDTIMSAILSDFRGCCANAPQRDDITLMVAKIV